MQSRSVAKLAPTYSPARLLDQPEAVNYLKRVRGVRTTRNTLRQWRHEGRGPIAAVIAGRLMYATSDLDAWVDEQVSQSRDSRRRAASARL